MPWVFSPFLRRCRRSLASLSELLMWRACRPYFCYCRRSSVIRRCNFIYFRGSLESVFWQAKLMGRVFSPFFCYWQCILCWQQQLRFNGFCHFLSNCQRFFITICSRMKCYNIFRILFSQQQITACDFQRLPITKPFSTSEMRNSLLLTRTSRKCRVNRNQEN